LYLRDAGGETGKLAADAYHDLLNPRIVQGVKLIESDKPKGE
jgi:hypothetical protein